MWTTSYSAQNIWVCWPLSISVCIKKEDRRRQTKADRKPTPHCPGICRQTSHTTCPVMHIHNFAEHQFQRAETERDVDKPRQRQREITREREGEKEWVHNDRWAWTPSNLQSSCNMTKITQESNSEKVPMSLWGCTGSSLTIQGKTNIKCMHLKKK